MRQRGTPAALALRGQTALEVRLHMEPLELARGYDGFLRGAPEPTLLVAVCSTTPEHTRLAARYLYRFERPTSYPCKVSTRDPSRESCVVVVEPGARLVLLTLAVEEDSGRGLQALYSALERSNTVVVWTPEAATPAPLLLHELEPSGLSPNVGHRVHVLLGELDPAAQLDGDDWVDATVLHVTPVVQRRRHRLHVCSADDRNDWTAVLDVAVRRA